MYRYSQLDGRVDFFEITFVLTAYFSGALFFMDMFTDSGVFSVSYLIVALYATVSDNVALYLKGILSASVLGFMTALVISIVVLFANIVAFLTI